MFCRRGSRSWPLAAIGVTAAGFFEMVNPHAEAHRGEHAGWLRAAVLGANDGLVSTASLMSGSPPAAPQRPRC